MNYWLAKQEPSGPRGYNVLQLQKDKKTMWDGVHNNLALKHIRNMKKDDLVFFYHTGDERQVVGIMSVISNPYPNPEEENKRFVVVDVKFKKLLKTPVTLDSIKKQKKLFLVEHIFLLKDQNYFFLKNGQLILRKQKDVLYGIKIIKNTLI